MGRSLTAFSNIVKQELKESKLNEIFDSKPFKTSFVLKDTPDWVETEKFQDRKGNTIKVYFHKLGRDFYEVDFSFNEYTEKDPGTTLSFIEYSELLATVAAAITQFLKEYEPKAVDIDGADEKMKIFNKPEAENQKNRIYLAFVSGIKDENRYYYISRGAKSGTLALVRRSGEHLMIERRK